jgi:hypothetical protein
LIQYSQYSQYFYNILRILHWTEDEAEQTLYALLEEGKIQETEERSGKFEPTERSMPTE